MKRTAKAASAAVLQLCNESFFDENKDQLSTGSPGINMTLQSASMQQQVQQQATRNIGNIAAASSEWQR